MNPSTALARVIVSALTDLGVRHAVLCPGSRSAPLAYALAEAAAAGRIGLQVRIDERSAGFLALGLAMASGPVAVITTSGTAVANLHPAVLEASHAGRPLLVLSADRPHELRGIGSNQTTDQVRMFATALRWFAEIPAPDDVRPAAVAGWRNVVVRAVAAASGRPVGLPGPVQLNICFAEPLTPDGGGLGGGVGPGDGVGVGPAGLTRVDGRPPDRRGVPAEWLVSLPAGPRTVVLAGDGAGPEAAALAAEAGLPLLAEPSSGARTAGCIGPYRLLLARPELGAAIERVILFGRTTLSRPVTRLLARDDVELIVVSRRPDWPDPGRRAARVVPGVRLEPAARHGGAGPVARVDGAGPAWATAWRDAGIAAARAIDEVLDAEAAAGRLTGALVARELAAATGPGDVLFVGSSAPIRDLDLAAGPFPAGATVLANRGLAGIDGTLSTASGVALARSSAGAGSGSGSRSGSGAELERAGPGQVRCLVGDLTFLHDAGGLLVGRAEERPQLQIVVVDDEGGGIFEGLEPGALAGHGPAERADYERLFATPQQVDLAALGAGYLVSHRLVTELDDLRTALAEPAPGTSVLQVRVDRAGHRALAERLARAVADVH